MQFFETIKILKREKKKKVIIKKQKQKGGKEKRKKRKEKKRKGKKKKKRKHQRKTPTNRENCHLQNDVEGELMLEAHLSNSGEIVERGGWCNYPPQNQTF